MRAFDLNGRSTSVRGDCVLGTLGTLKGRVQGSATRWRKASVVKAMGAFFYFYYLKRRYLSLIC